MAISDLTDWIDEYARPGVTWYAKRLAANDTLASGSHQAGPYIPRDFLFELFPELGASTEDNQDVFFQLCIDSHPDVKTVRAIWYNNKFRGGTRNETRLTNFGGRESALLDPDNTGALAVFTFFDAGEGTECRVWVCSNSIEEDLLEERLGPVEPKSFIIWRPGLSAPQADPFSPTPKAPAKTSCWLDEDEIPEEWKTSFPSGLQIIGKTIEMRPHDGSDVDVRLIRRRKCEFEIFRSVESATFLPQIKGGFEDVDSFLGLANTILQSRKSRSGKSLEYHAMAIFNEEGFVRGTHYEHNAVIEGGKRPDFLFPTVEAYENKGFSDASLRMLAAKTTCKDRWRQILNEADRIPRKHLLTLQEGVSEGQFREMTDAGVRLVVPAGLHDAYPEAVRPHLVTVENFLGDLRVVLARAGL